MPLGNESQPPQGQTDHVIGTAHRGQNRAKTDRITTSTGDQIVVPLYEFPENAGVPKRKTEPEPEFVSGLSELKKDIGYRDKPIKHVLTDDIENLLAYDLFMDGVLSTVEIAISSVLERSYWVLPRDPKPVMIFPRDSWERMQRIFVNMINPDIDGPINAELFSDPLLKPLFDPPLPPLTRDDLNATD
tara:strand:- start:5796 stop:6359 length:564 start_codon:yes stop_codon:yes gene_type:complete